MGLRWGYTSHHILAYHLLWSYEFMCVLLLCRVERFNYEWMGGELKETEILEEKCIHKRGTRGHHHRHMWHHNMHDSWETNPHHTALGKQNQILFHCLCIWIFVCICMHLGIYWFVCNTIISMFVCRHIELTICSTKAARTSAKHDCHISNSVSRYKLF